MIKDMLRAALYAYRRMKLKAFILYKNPIFVVGDSHSYFFLGKEKFSLIPVIHKTTGGVIRSDVSDDGKFIVFHLGPVLAYNAIEPNSSMNVLGKMSAIERFLKRGSYVIFSFGEIDIRAHVFKNAEIPWRENVENIIDRYMLFLKIYKRKGYRVIAYSPIASQKDALKEDARFPRKGTEEERNRATIYFGKLLKKKCDCEGIKVLSISDCLIDDNYKTKGEYILEDGCHLNQKARAGMERRLKDCMIE